MFNNILAIRNDRFGEFLLNIPAFRALKESNPGARLTLAVHPYVTQLARCIGGVDEVIAWENRKHSLSELISFGKELKDRRFDLCVVLNPSKDSHIACFFAGIPVRAGYNRKWGFLLNKTLRDEKALGLKHEVEYNLGLVRIVGADTHDKSLSLAVKSGIISNLIPETTKPIAIHPWTSDPLKQWPEDRFRGLVEKLLGSGERIVIIGGIEEAGRSRELFEGLQDKVTDLTGKTDLLQLAALLKRCRLLISGDSGPVHLATCVGIPVLALFRNDLIGKTAKRWGPWSKSGFVIEKSRLEDISVEEVLTKAREILR